MTTHCSILTTTAEFDALESAWRELFATSPSAAPPLHWTWIRNWWQHFGHDVAKDEGSLRILVVKDNETVIGILPLYQHRASTFGGIHLALLSVGEPTHETTYPEYTDVLYAPGRSNDCLKVLATTLNDKTTLPWDEISLGLTAAGSVLNHLCSSGFFGPSVIFRRARLESFIAHLHEGHNRYLDRLGTSRHTCRRLMRGAASLNAELTIASDIPEIKAALQSLFELHQARWNSKEKSGSFSTGRIKAFHLEVVCSLKPIEEIVLSTLNVKDKTIAAIYGLRCRKKIHNYQSGLIDPQLTELKSPGLVCHLLNMKGLIHSGVEQYDFLAGDSTYKSMLSHTSATLFALNGFRVSRRTMPGLLAKVCRKSVKRWGNYSPPK